MPGVPCDWLSETAIVLKPSGTPPAADTPSLTRSARSRWLRLHGIVPVHVDATPMIGPSSRAGSTPMARKCARAGARSAPSSSPARARRRRASTGASVTPSTVLQWQDRSMRIATLRLLDGATLAVDGPGGYRRLDFEGDLVSLVRAGIDPRDLGVGDAVEGELAAPLRPGKIVAI